MARKKMTPQKEKLIYKLVEAGKTDTEIIKTLDIGKWLFYAWLREDPDARKKIDDIRDNIVMDKALKALKKKIEGGYVEEEKRVVFKDSNGKESVRVEKSKRYIPPDTTAIIFATKNIRPSKWNDRRDLTITGMEDGVVIKIQDARDAKRDKSSS